jgi:hypothetical protein
MLFGRVAVEVFFGCVGVRFGRRHKPIVMLGRAVERVQLHALAARIDNIMARPCRNDEGVVGFDLRSLAVDPDLTFALLDPEELVSCFVNFFADFFAGRQRH